SLPLLPPRFLVGSCSCRSSCPEASSSSRPGECTSPSSWPGRSGCALWAAFVWAREARAPPPVLAANPPWWGCPRYCAGPGDLKGLGRHQRSGRRS
ncbi:hypothetical protein AAFF_G00013150, partial [Aldrovandia affinis]